MGDAHQHHVSRRDRARRVLDIGKALEQQLPGPRQNPQAQLLRKSRAARALLGHGRRNLRRAGKYLEPRHHMRELGKIGQNLGGVGAKVILRLHQVQRPGNIAAHHRLKQVDDPAAVGKTQHVTHIVRDNLRLAGRGRRAIGDGLVEQGQRVTHRSLGGAGDHGERVRGGHNAFHAANPRQMGDKHIGFDAFEVKPQAARAHRDRNFFDFSRRKNEFHMRRRLFQRLQEAVEGGLGEHVHLVDDVDLGAG